MKNYSIWQEYKLKNYARLKNDLTTDILIIGGGITGLNIFYALKDDTRNIVLVDKNRIGQGITARSSAKITYLQADIYSKIKDLTKAKIYYEANIEAMHNYAEIITKEKIDCDFEKVKSYLLAYQKKEIKKVQKEEEFLTLVGNPNLAKTNLKDTLYTYQGIDSYVFHPLKYLDQIAQKSIKPNHQIYEETGIYNLNKIEDGYEAFTEKYKIKAQIVIIATHYPSFLVPYLFPLKCYLEKSTLMASKEANLKYSSINILKPICSYRFFKEYRLKVGSTHALAWQNNDLKNEEAIDQKNALYTWSNYDVITFDYLPLIGFIDSNLILATGYNTWGMTGSMLAAMIIKDLCQNKENKYQALMDPRRGNLNKIKSYPLNIWFNAYAFLDSKINKNKKYYHNNPKFLKLDGKNVAIYQDERKKEHIVYNKCPHLGCSLNFNEVEKTWDCPCHGSRFSLDGKCLLGPSNKDITYKKNN